MEDEACVPWCGRSRRAGKRALIRVSTPVPKPPVAKAPRRERPATTRVNERRRQKILVAAEEVFARDGYRASTVRDIADRAGILSGSLYYHFESKEAIALAIIGPHLEHVIRRQAQVLTGVVEPADAIRRLIEENMATIWERPAVIAIMHNDWPYLRKLPDFAAVVVLYEAVATPWLEVIRRGVDDGVFLEGHDEALIYRSIQSMFLATARWFDPTGPLSSADLTRMQADLVLGGLLARSPSAS